MCDLPLDDAVVDVLNQLFPDGNAPLCREHR